MPLSEHEQNLLSQLEQQLQADDPKFASTMRGHVIAGGGRRLVLGLIAVIAGLCIIVLAAANPTILWLAVPGFIVMLFGATYAFSSGKRSGPRGTVQQGGSTRPRQGRSRDGLMNRLEQRWDARREQDGH